MRKLTPPLLLASILVAGVLTAPPLHAEGTKQNEQCDMMRGDHGGMMQDGQGGMMGRGGMMRGDGGGMMGQGGMMQGDQGGMMGQGRMMRSTPEAMMGMMKQMSQMMKQMAQMMDMMGDSRPNEQEKKNAPSEPEKK